ncbi:MAG: nucleoside monophosphate kinase [Lentisphaerae bacterium]|nr:nucleoside monophosphate kinase [Lentisphaerota bacterium]
MSIQRAILLLGPTGAGKSPLGDYLAAVGLWRRRCHHFDFGAELRRVGRDGGPGLSATDVAYIGRVLREGALLEDETFYIACEILERFLAAQGVGEHDLVVLNGLPRHAGQARDVGQIVDVRCVIALECGADTVRARIADNSGGDRAERTDDSLEKITRRLALYATRTHPLLDHYRSKGVQLRLISVGVNTTPADIVDAVREERVDRVDDDNG